jgi:hypothetical protein
MIADKKYKTIELEALKSVAFFFNDLASNKKLLLLLCASVFYGVCDNVFKKQLLLGFFLIFFWQMERKHCELSEQIKS